jgi:hypothetical protein
VDLRHVGTPRLRLDAVVPGDLDEHLRLMSDPRSWTHLPSGRHADPAKTAEGIRHSVGHWERDGLGYWTARLREDLPASGLKAGAVVGTGGCATRDGTTWWNLVIAHLVEHDVQSRRRAERSGPALVWRGPDTGNPDPAAVRLVYADRPLDDEVLAAVIART